VTTQSGYEHLLRVHVFSSVPREPEQFPRLRAVFGARRFLLLGRRLIGPDETVTGANHCEFALLDYENPNAEITPALLD
jgi:hypothetical protein